MKKSNLIKELAKPQKVQANSPKFSYSKPLVKPEANAMNTPRRAREMRTSKPKPAQQMCDMMKKEK